MSIHHHTLRVHFLRSFLPTLAVIGLVVVAAWPTINDFRTAQMAKYSITRARVDSVALTLPSAGHPAQLQVTNPQFDGLDLKSRPYTITADRVLQGLQVGSAMTLEHPIAKLILNENKDYVTLRGKTGLYDPVKKTLTLNDDVILTHSDGYTLNMQDLFIDLNAGTSLTKTPVTGAGPMGQLSGESLELLDQGDHIILHGKSKVTLTPKAAS